ncbi:MAG: lysostaphin resistance A-like protein [Conexivisphaerales archaeon]
MKIASLKLSYVSASIPLAYLLWFVTFYLRPFNFWFDISLSSLILFLVVITSGRKIPLVRKGLGMQSFVAVLSALILYLVFFFGNRLTYLLPSAGSYVQSIYALALGTNPLLLSVLLIFPIASGEEVFWRGFVQTSFSERYGNKTGYLISVLGDTTVHLSSLNPMLILSAFITSLVWAFIFLYTKSLLPSLTSHIIWDLLVFVLIPVR